MRTRRKRIVFRLDTSDTSVADAEAELGRVDTLEPLDVPGASLCEARESRENPHRSIQSMVFSGK